MIVKVNKSANIIIIVITIIFVFGVVFGPLKRVHAAFAYRSAREQNCRVLFQPSGGDDDPPTYTLLIQRSKKKRTNRGGYNRPK